MNDFLFHVFHVPGQHRIQENIEILRSSGKKIRSWSRRDTPYKATICSKFQMMEFDEPVPPSCVLKYRYENMALNILSHGIH